MGRQSASTSIACWVTGRRWLTRRCRRQYLHNANNIESKTLYESRASSEITRNDMPSAAHERRCDGVHAPPRAMRTRTGFGKAWARIRPRISNLPMAAIASSAVAAFVRSVTITPSIDIFLLNEGRRGTRDIEPTDPCLPSQQRDILCGRAARRTCFQIRGNALVDLLERERRTIDLAVQADHMNTVMSISVEKLLAHIRDVPWFSTLEMSPLVYAAA